jgi:hypothetical protein
MSFNSNRSILHDSLAAKVAELRWRANLDASEHSVVSVAERLHNVLPTFGAIYRAAFFLHHYLANTHAVSGEVIVGFVHNGMDDVYRSHAWYVFQDRVTDLAISRMGGVGSDRAGSLLIHGFEFAPGAMTWSYHTGRPSGSRIALQDMVPDPENSEELQQAEDLHLHAVDLACHPRKMREYLDQAPDEINYRVLANMLDMIS